MSENLFSQTSDEKKLRYASPDIYIIGPASTKTQGVPDVGGDDGMFAFGALPS